MGSWFTQGVLAMAACCALATYGQPLSAHSPRLLRVGDANALHLLRVEYVHNPDSLPMERSELAAVLKLAKEIAWEHLRLRIGFSEDITARDIADLFAQLSPREREKIASAVYDFRNGRGDKALLIARTAHTLRHDQEDNAQAREFAAPYLLAKPESDSLQDFSQALVETQLLRLQSYKDILRSKRPLPPGGNLVNEYPFWLDYAMVRSTHQLTLTNQLIAGAEYLGNSVHSALRGGISNGLTVQAKHSDSGLSSVVSLYPFYSEDAALLAIRDGRFASPEQRRRAVATLIVHEIGHQILHLGHPYGNHHCLMRPPELLHFKKWLDQLDAEQCRKASPESMKPGFVRFLDTR